MISINGSAIQTPSAFSVSIEDISKADRNTNGEIRIERIATKRKLELTFSYAADVPAILDAVGLDVFFSVSYPDPWTGSTRTATFYCGSRSVGMIDFQDSVPRWKDLKFNLVEQ